MRWIAGFCSARKPCSARCREAYENYEFHAVYHTLNNFCSVDLSAQYLDIVKDRLYCEGAKSTKRRAAQTTLYRILDVLVHLMAPILSFTAEEIWRYMPDKDRRAGSVFLSHIPEPDASLGDDAARRKMGADLPRTKRGAQSVGTSANRGNHRSFARCQSLVRIAQWRSQLDFNGPCSR